MQVVARKFWELEVPTWILAVEIYGAWFLLILYHPYIPWWAMIFLGGHVIAWQFSLQHETIHGFRGVPAWFRTRAFIEHRAGTKLLKYNGDFVFTGYWPIARDYMFKPVFMPVYPTV